MKLKMIWFVLASFVLSACGELAKEGEECSTDEDCEEGLECHMHEGEDDHGDCEAHEGDDQEEAEHED